MLPCPQCGNKVGLHNMRTHAGKTNYRQYRCGTAGRDLGGCGLVFTTHETVVLNEALRNQIVQRYGDRAPAELERMFGKPAFKYKDIRLKPRG